MTETVRARRGLAAFAIRGVAASSVLLLGATLASNALNAAFHFVLARVLEPAEYSLLATLLVVVLILTVPFLALQAAVAREVAAALARGDDAAAGAVVRAAFRGLGKAGAAVFGVAAIAAYPVAQVVHVADPWPVLATAAAFVASLAVPPAWGALQGSQRFRALGAAQVAWALLRLLLAVAIGLAGGGAAGAMAGVAAGTAASAVLALLPLAKVVRAGGRGSGRTLLVSRYVGGAGTGFALFTALTSIDVLVARLAFSPHQAGLYAAASVGARSLLLVPTAVTTVLFPRVATLGDPLRERRHLLAGLAGVAAPCAAGVVVLFAAAGPLAVAGFGADYRDAGRWLGALGAASALYALVYVYLLHFLALGRTAYVTLLTVLATTQLALFAVFHEEPSDLVAVQLTVAAAALAAGELLDRSSRA